VASDEKHPIVAGVTALVAVGLVIGLLFGGFTLVASHVLGIGDDGGSTATDSGPSLYLPTPEPTQSSSGTTEPGTATSAPPSSAPPTSTAPADDITLQAGKAKVGSMERIDLTGVYQGGEGAVLQVQRMDDKKWEDFPVTAAVSGGTFSTYVQTGRSGVQKFRVRDSDSGKVSNVVSVTVG
jgi:hypothetical protein